MAMHARQEGGADGKRSVYMHCRRGRAQPSSGSHGAGLNVVSLAHRHPFAFADWSQSEKQHMYLCLFFCFVLEGGEVICLLGPPGALSSCWPWLSLKRRAFPMLLITPSWLWTGISPCFGGFFLPRAALQTKAPNQANKSPPFFFQTQANVPHRRPVALPLPEADLVRLLALARRNSSRRPVLCTETDPNRRLANANSTKLGACRLAGATERARYAGRRGKKKYRNFPLSKPKKRGTRRATSPDSSRPASLDRRQPLETTTPPHPLLGEPGRKVLLLLKVHEGGRSGGKCGDSSSG